MTQKKSILITGCSTGIGLCLAHGLSNRGYHVIASCRSQKDVATLSESGLDTVLLDLDDTQSITTGFNQALELADGDIFSLINNGAYGQPGAVEDLTRTSLREQFETNVFGTQELTNLVIPLMRKKNVGRIVQISSVLGFICLKYRGAYNASKYALEALTDTMRQELMDTNIFFSLVEPGPIASDFRKNAYTKYCTHINRESSAHRDKYQTLEDRLLSEQPVRYQLPAEAVLNATIHALESKNPKIRYRVTTPTKVMAILKRVLSDKWMDKFLNAN